MGAIPSRAPAAEAAAFVFDVYDPDGYIVQINEGSKHTICCNENVVVELVKLDSQSGAKPLTAGIDLKGRIRLMDGYNWALCGGKGDGPPAKLGDGVCLTTWEGQDDVKHVNLAWTMDGDGIIMPKSNENLAIGAPNYAIRDATPLVLVNKHQESVLRFKHSGWDKKIKAIMKDSENANTNTNTNNNTNTNTNNNANNISINLGMLPGMMPGGVVVPGAAAEPQPAAEPQQVPSKQSGWKADLETAFKSSKCENSYPKAVKWCDDQGVAEISEAIDMLEDMINGCELKPLEAKRLREHFTKN